MILADLQIVAAALLILTPLERLLPLHRRDKFIRPGFGTDVLHLFVSGFLIRSGTIVTTVVLALAAGSLLPPQIQESVQRQPLWVQFLELFVLSDLCFYLAHRIVHSVPWLWRFHAVHHSSEQLDWLAAYRVHPVDQIFNSTIIIVPAVALGFAPGVLVAYALLYRWHALLLHSNINISFGPLAAIFATPRFHHWHHADEPQAFNKNFGGQLIIWDRLFGTAHRDQSLPSRYGSGGVPSGYLQQLYAPFVGSRASGGVSSTPRADS